MKPTSEILKRIAKNSSEHSTGIYTRLYRYLLRQDIYLNAYQNLYSNKGAGTKGINSDTADGFSIDYVQDIIGKLKNQTYQPKPVKRIFIAKRNGKKRPLGLPTFTDKLVQDAIRQILQAIYEPIFSNFSHGFRPKRSCHSALQQMSKYFHGTKWFIEGDIKSFFDNIDHCVLLKLLSEKIKDGKFIRLIAKFLRAGYMENWQYHKTYSGTPQGGILSPILANIYLHELDKQIEHMQKDFAKPPLYSTCSPIYGQKRRKILALQKSYAELTDSAEKKALLKSIQRLKVELRKLPCKHSSDKKIAYVRYADDFLIGVCGSKQNCQFIKQTLKDFLAKTLKLELSEDKTKIKHSSQPVRFLGYDIRVRRSSLCKRRSDGVVLRTLNNSVERLVPFADIEKFLYTNKIVIQNKDGSLVPFHRADMLNLTDLEIIDTYNSQTRGICNYFSLASNFSKLNYFVYLMEYGCLRTLAMKHKSSIAKIKKFYKAGHSWGVPYQCKNGTTQRMMIVLFKNLQKGKVYSKDYDLIRHHNFYNTRTTLDKRLSASKCELCGKTGNVSLEIHHINKIKNLKGHRDWEKVMIARKRKTLVVCKECHLKIHHSS